MNKLKGLKIAILVTDGFEQIELEKPREALEKEGATTFLISPEKTEVLGFNHHEKGDLFRVDINLNDAKVNDYDGLVLPGGVINPDSLRTSIKAINFIKAMNEMEKPIAAICHGPQTLIDAEAVKGKRLTSWPSIKVDLINAGAKWEDKVVVSDKNLVTSRKPDDIPYFNKEMIALFSEK